MESKNLTEIDKKIGIAIQERRIALGMSRYQLANKIGVTHQQTQKYEKGMNRISIGRYYDICNALNIMVNDPLLNDDKVVEVTHDRLIIDTSRNFQKLNRKHQEAVSRLIRSMSDD